MSTTSVKPTPEELLRKLLDEAFSIETKGLVWLFIENTSIRSVFDEEFEKQLIEYKNPDRSKE